jgi:hypothetical protein
VRWRQAGEVRVTTLDELIRRFGMPDFVKIDVEGLEGEVLAGLSRPPPALSFEYLTAARDRALACVDRLETLGEYRYNWSPGESHQLASARWLDAAGMRAALARLTQGSGDVYAWRADVAGGTRAEGSQQGLGEVRHAAQGRAPGDQAGDKALGHKGIPDLRPLGDEVDRDLPGGPLPADGGQGLVVPEHQQHQIQVGPEAQPAGDDPQQIGHRVPIGGPEVRQDPPLAPRRGELLLDLRRVEGSAVRMRPQSGW